MAITYASQAGTIITSYAMTETLADQGQQTGNNTVVVSDTPGNATGTGGNIGDGTNGVGDSYVGRIVIISLAGTPQVRRVVSEAAGTGTTFILTVHEDWDTNPVVTTDTIDVCYEYADMEDGGASGGISLGAKTGLWTLSNTLTIGNATDPAGLQGVAGQALEVNDDGNNISFYILNNGYYYLGYEAGGSPINGGIVTGYNNSAAEPWIQFASGSFGYLFDSIFWNQLVTQQFEMANGSDVTFWGSKMLSTTEELHLYDTTLINCTIGGRGVTTEIVRVDAGTSINGLILSNVDTLDTVADTTTETIELGGVSFSGVTDYINVRDNKTWNMIDPLWDATTYTDFTWVGSTLNAVNDRKSIKATVATAAGTLLQDALVNIYEGTQLQDLVLELTTDVNGYAEDSFIYRAHVTNSATTTYGNHSLQAGKWLYLPFVATQVSTVGFEGTIVLSPDNNIVQTTQATAKSAGSTITWNEDTNPSSIIDFTGGSGGTIGLAVGDTITGAGGATGIVTQIVDGNDVAGTIHLKTRNATDFVGSETIDNGADGWTATFTAATQQDFSIWIDGQDLSIQTIYDYLSAIQNETTLTVDGEKIWEWCQEDQTQPLYATGTSFNTVESVSKGIFVVDYGSGTMGYMTDDTGTQFTPPTTVTIQITVKDKDNVEIENAQTAVFTNDAIKTELLNADTNASGIASASYNYTGDQSVKVRVRKASPGSTKYQNFSTVQTVTSTGLYLAVTLLADPNNP